MHPHHAEEFAVRYELLISVIHLHLVAQFPWTRRDAVNVAIQRP